MRKLDGNTRNRLSAEKTAKALITAAASLSLIVLALIVGFIVVKGFVKSDIVLDDFLVASERAPDGFTVVVNPKTRKEGITWKELSGAFTDDYIDWTKLSEQSRDILPLLPDTSSAEGASALVFLFGTEDGGASLGGLVAFLPSAGKVLDKVALTEGTIAIVPASAVGARKDVKVLPLRRISLAVNPRVTELVGNSQMQSLPLKEAKALAAGAYSNWKDLGGLDIPISFVSPPPGSEPEAIASASGFLTGTGKGGEPAADEDKELEAGAGKAASSESEVRLILDNPGAVGFLTASEAEAAGLSILTLERRVTERNLDLKFLLEPPGLSGKVGGVSTILLNTLFMIVLTLVFAVPLGVGASVYLVEYAKEGRLIRLIRTGSETLAGIPSIVFGLFGMLFFSDILKLGVGLLSGCLTLALMILPTIMRTSEEALKTVPQDMRAGSLALGATKLQTIFRVVLPAASPGILAGTILGIGRCVGETAAILFTMGTDYRLANGLSSSARTLAVHVYLLIAEGTDLNKAFATGTILIFVVLLVNFAATKAIGRISRMGVRV